MGGHIMTERIIATTSNTVVNGDQVTASINVDSIEGVR